MIICVKLCVYENYHLCIFFIIECVILYKTIKYTNLDPVIQYWRKKKNRVSIGFSMLKNEFVISNGKQVFICL